MEKVNSIYKQRKDKLLFLRICSKSLYFISRPSSRLEEKSTQKSTVSNSNYPGVPSSGDVPKSWKKSNYDPRRSKSTRMHRFGYVTTDQPKISMRHDNDDHEMYLMGDEDEEDIGNIK